MKRLHICRWALAAAAGILALALGCLTVYALKTGFTYEYMRALLMLLLPGVLVMTALGLLCVRLRRGEKAPKETVKRCTPYPEKEMPAKRRNMLRGAVIVLAVLLIVLGIANGGLWDVLVKAINICTECIGLG